MKPPLPLLAALVFATAPAIAQTPNTANPPSTPAPPDVVLTQRDKLRMLEAYLKFTEKQIEDTLDSVNRTQALTEITDFTEQYARLKAVDLERKTEAQGLARQLGSDKDQVAFAAAYLIGELRLDADIPQLVVHINLETTRRWAPDGDFSPLWGSHPAEEALVKFGSIATPGIIEGIAEGPDARSMGLLVDALQKNMGGPGAKGALADAANAEPDPVRKGRLVAAMGMVVG